MPSLYADLRDIKVCGPRLAIFGIVISVWGIIQLSAMGLACLNKSVAFIGDLTFEENNKTSAESVKDVIKNQFTIVSKNCGVAVALYILTLIVAVHQMWVNTDRRIHIIHGVRVENVQQHNKQ